ncbi:MAG: InlB B-repeat-containing protein, partial [Clostridiaceae bacterium]|nr:InlB B-repeat-containing protein [Clostridiaceae bacterium]
MGNRKRMLAVLTVLLIICGMIYGISEKSAKAKNFIDPDTGIIWSATIEDGMATNLYTADDIEETVLSSGALIVPNEVTDSAGNSYPVVSIGNPNITAASSFLQGDASLTYFSVDFSQAASLTAIHNYAFYNCYKITEIELPDTVEEIGTDVFYGCTALSLKVQNLNLVLEGDLGVNELQSYSQSTMRDYYMDNMYAAYGETHWKSLGDSFCVEIDAGGGSLSSGLLQDYYYAINGMETLDLDCVAAREHYTLDGYYSSDGTEYYDYDSEKDELVRKISSFSDIEAETLVLTAEWIPDTYKVTLNTNGGTVTSGAISSYQYTKGATLPAGADKTGYTFQGWYTAEDLTGESITKIGPEEYGDKNFYAGWEANTFTIVYDANGGSGSMPNQTMTYDTVEKLPANAFSRTGYTFQGWTTASSSSTVTYADQESVKNLSSTSGSTVTLYAVWKANSYTVTYDTNGGSGTMSSSTVTYGDVWTASKCSFTKTGYTFAGWNTKADGSGTAYEAGLSATCNTAAGYTLYAQWEANTFTIAYDANGGSGSMANQTMTYDTEAKLTANAYTRTGYSFQGWSTASSSSTVTYADQESVKNLSSKSGDTINLYAVWKVNTYTITYILSDGCFEGDVLEQYTYGIGLELPIPSRTGFSFSGWFTSYDCSGTPVTEIGITDCGNITLYASWSTNSYSITYDLGSDAAQISGEYATSYNYSLQSVSLPSSDQVTRNGYTFLGWWDGSQIVTKIAEKEIGNKSFQALWQENSSTAVAVVEMESTDGITEEVSTDSAAEDINTGYYFDQLTETEQMLYKTMYHVYCFIPEEKQINCTEAVLLSSKIEFTRKNVKNAQAAFILEHPEIFWLRYLSVSAVTESDGVYQCGVYPVAAYNTAVYTADALTFYGYYTKALEDIGVSDTDTDYEKVKKIHDYIITTYSYSSTGYTLNEATSNDTRSVGRMLASRIGCCEGFASLMKLFCDEYGISCVLVTGSNHMWNEIQVDGIWYGLDATFDTVCQDKYFLKGKSTFEDGSHNLTNSFYVNSATGEKITDYGCFAAPEISEEDYEKKGVTEEPSATDQPGVTEEPSATDQPGVTDEPTSTEAPV